MSTLETHLKLIKEDFDCNKSFLLRKLQKIYPEAKVTGIAIGGSIAKGTATQKSDIDIEVYYKGNVEDQDVWYRLSNTIYGYGGTYDIIPRKKG